MNTQAASSRFQGFLRSALIALALILLWKLTLAAIFDIRALSYPYSLDYGEGIVWQQMRNMLRGTAYAPLETFPAIVYHYPPVFHLTTAAAAWIGDIDPLAAGRLVEIVSTAATGFLIALLTTQSLPNQDGQVKVRAICGFFSALVYLTSYIVSDWAPLMRVDMLSGALGLWGIWLTLRAFDRPICVYAAAFAFVLSIYTKQTSVAAPVAAFSILLIARPRAAIVGIGTSLLLGLGALAWCEWMSHGGFLQHVLSYNLNRIDACRIIYLLKPSVLHIPLSICAAFGIAFAWNWVRESIAVNTTWRQAIIRQRQTAIILMMLVFFLLKIPMIGMMLKVGSNSNYLIELLSALAFFFGLSLWPVVGAALGTQPISSRLPTLLAIGVAVGMPVQAIMMPNPEFRLVEDKRAAEMESIVDHIRRSPKPVISDEMTLLIRAGRDVQWEPAIVAELAHSKIYDQQRFVKMIDEKNFGFFVIEWGPNYSLFLDRYNKPVAEAIAANYPRTEKIGNLTLFFPMQDKPSSRPTVFSVGQSVLD